MSGKLELYFKNVVLIRFWYSDGISQNKQSSLFSKFWGLYFKSEKILFYSKQFFIRFYSSNGNFLTIYLNLLISSLLLYDLLLSSNQLEF